MVQHFLILHTQFHTVTKIQSRSESSIINQVTDIHVRHPLCPGDQFRNHIEPEQIPERRKTISTPSAQEGMQCSSHFYSSNCPHHDAASAPHRLCCCSSGIITITSPSITTLSLTEHVTAMKANDILILRTSASASTSSPM